MALCLLFEMNLPKFLWAEVANTANYLLNMTQTKSLGKKTPYEAWFGFKPTVTHLKVFRCICYAKKPDAKRTKLDENLSLQFIWAIMKFLKATSYWMLRQGSCL